MGDVEGRQSVLAALRVGKRKFQALRVSHGGHEDKVREVLDLAAERGVTVRRADPRELDAIAHGSSHGGRGAVFA